MAYASVEQGETEILLRHILNSGHDVVKADAPDGTRFWFRDMGPLGNLIENSPIVVFHRPRQLAAKLWSIGRFFFPQPNLSKRFPELDKIRKAISRDISAATLIWTWKEPENGDFNYYLEGSIRNRDYVLYGMSSCLAYLRSEGYFVGGDETEGVLDRLRRSLALRGVII